MSKTIKIPYLSEYTAFRSDEYAWQRTLTLDVYEFASRSRERDLSLAPASWLYAGLIVHDSSTAKFKLSPRGEDLLASVDSIPDDPQPEVKTKPCSKCHGSGEQPLFVSMETCDRCKGSKVEPRTAEDIIADYAVQIDRGRVSFPGQSRDNLQAIGRMALDRGYYVFVHDSIQIDCPTEQSVKEEIERIWNATAKTYALPPFQTVSDCKVRL